MRIYDRSELWWHDITGPRQVVTSVAQSLISQYKVALRVPADLPWRHPMRRAIEDQIHMTAGSSDTVIDLIDAGDEWDPGLDPGRFLLQRCAPSAVVRGYREKGGTSIQDYMIGNSVLRDTIVWVKGLEQEQTRRWLRFCRDFHSKSARDGLFILETRGDVPEARGVRIVALEDHVREYDVQLFNSLILDDLDAYDDTWKRYAATLAAHLCGTDAEVSDLFLHTADICRDDPLEVLSRLAAMPELEKRGGDPAGGHVLALVRSTASAELERRIWSAQIQVLFPQIETERLYIVRQLGPQLKDCLRAERIEQFGQLIALPEDVELGTLDYLMSRRTDGRPPLLPAQDAALRARVHFLRDCRNALAHGSCCTCGQVATLLDGAPAGRLEKRCLT